MVMECEPGTAGIVSIETGKKIITGENVKEKINRICGLTRYGKGER